ncbi:MAG: DUF882 domain-containing protein [Vicinamibacterales bacterium]
MHVLSRRRFVGCLAAPLLAPSALAAESRVARSLAFDHTHTGERLIVDYFRDGAYDPDALLAVNHLLRDFRTNESHVIHHGLLDLLHRLARVTDTHSPFEVISGYRSPATNAMLRRRSEGVAAGSLHMVGEAIDIRLTDVPLQKLRQAALALRGGGVGFYPASNFVHVDVGRVRTW